MTDLTNTENNLPSDLNQLTVEIKFYVNQWGQNTIEIGKRLIAAKELVAHGDWQNWLEVNFNLTERTAQNFMRIAERFGKTKLISDLNSTQMIAMLSLPKGEEEKFIAEKAAEGTPVEDMTVKNLREEVAKWKADFEKQKSEVENLFSDKTELERKNSILQKNYDDKRDAINKLTVEKNNLQEQLKNQTPIEKLPDDYEPLKKEREQLQTKIAQLQKQLTEKPIEVQVPADYESNKNQLAELQAKYDEISKFAVLIQKFDSIAEQIEDVIYSKFISQALAYYYKYDSGAYAKMAARVKDFARVFKEDDD